ncbi:MAG: ABC transporter permease [Thermomicrobiales bacterium]
MATQVLPQSTESITLDLTLDDEQIQARRRVNPMVAYVARRFGLYLITLWGAFTASFIFFRLLPGDPITAMVSELARQGEYSSQSGSEEVVEHYQEVFGLNGSLLEQYLRYMERLIIHQDFGPSIMSYPTSSMELVLRSLPWTIGLVGTATLLGWVIGVIGGTFVGRARRSRVGDAITNVALLLSHIPAYFVALFLVFFLAYRNPIFPPNGAYNASLEIGWSWDFIVSVIKYGTLPVVATVIVSASGWLIGTRALVVNILGEDYLTYAEAKGLSPWRILNRYVMRNAWLPQIAALGIVMGGVINGNILVERLFRYPGIGNLSIEAINRKDVNTAQGVIAILIFGVLTLNLIIDLLLPLFDPRIKHTR